MSASSSGVKRFKYPQVLPINILQNEFGQECNDLIVIGVSSNSKSLNDAITVAS